MAERTRSKVVSPRHWEYRIVKRHLPEPENHDWYGIHECYFRDGVLDAITESPATLESESVAGVNEVRVMMFQAIKNPVIDYDAFVASLPPALPQGVRRPIHASGFNFSTDGTAGMLGFRDEGDVNG